MVSLFSTRKKEDSTVSSQNADVSETPNPNNTVSGPANTASLVASIERLNAESIANKEVRAATNDRFAKLSESIGEIRNMLRNNEKSISLMEAKVEKTVGLVEAVQPQELLSSVNKVDFKIEALRAKVEANELIYNKIRDDIRDLRNKFVVFRNIEMVKEMNEDSKKRFRDLQRMEMDIVKHADRAESMFTEIEKAIKDSKENTKSIIDISDSIKKLLLASDKFKSELSLKISKQEFSKLQEALDKSKTEITDVLVKDLEDYKRKTIRDVEIAVKQDEVKLVQDLVKEDMKKSGIDLESVSGNDRILKMLIYMNMDLMIKDYDIDRKKMVAYKDNPYAFMVVAYAAMKLRNTDVSTLKKDLVSLGFAESKCEQIITNAKMLGKI